jgi:peptidoglycan/LPS O-acetylase OafA/YrhL
LGSENVMASSAPPLERVLLSGDEAGTAPEDRAFRPDVQGLRAVAVALVVLFHAHVPGLGGGYVGVDVFFVISGFVITGVLLRERASTGSTSILHFYGRRARRIIPAATLVIVAAVIASYVVLGPLGGNQAAGDGRWASVFLINFHFADSGTNYLASQLPPSVLQNFWSLAVEEQFYLVYPMLFLLVAGVSWRLPLRGRLGLVLGAAVIASFVASVVETSSNPNAAYFLPYPRVWELALGGLVAIGATSLRRVPAWTAATVSWLGLGSIVLAGCLFSSATAYPGWVVALPVVGAALVIAAGTTQPAYGAEALLRLRPFQWIGLVSYSLYLWHWPILTLAAQHSGTDSLPVTDALGWVAVSLGLAIVTYFLVEDPIRHGTFLLSRRWASVAMGGCLVVSSLTVATVEIHLHDQGATSATPGLGGLKTSNSCPPPTKQSIASLMGAGPKASHRVVARILVVGDSTACTMLPGLTAVGAPVGVRIENAAVIGCGVVSGTIAPQIINGRNVNSATRFCQASAVAAEARALRSGTPNIVLWGSSWERNSLAVGTGAHQKVLTAGSPQWSAALLKRMEQRVHEFTATGATVVLLTQAPFVETGNPTAPTPGDQTFERLNVLLHKFAAHRPHVKIVDLANFLCPSGPPCPIIVHNEWLRGDGAHFDAEGSLFVARWLMPQLGIKALHKPNDSLPTIKIILPKDGTILKGSTPLSSLTSYNLGMNNVQYRISGPTVHNAAIGNAVFGADGWLFYWNTASVPNGTYTLRSVVSNAAGDHASSKGVTVRVAN